MISSNVPPQSIQVSLQVAPQRSMNRSVSPEEFTLADKTAIHEAKIGASFWGAYWGFWKTGWDALFYNPQKAASKRLDVLEGKRSFQSGVTLEKEKKKAQQKASLLPAAIVTMLSLILSTKSSKVIQKYAPEFIGLIQSANNLPPEILEKRLDEYGDKLKVQLAQDPLVKNFVKTLVNSIGLQLATLILTPSLYALFEKPDSPDFNKQL